MLFLLLACNEYKISTPEVEPLVLTVTSPEYGSYLGDGPVTVTGTVSPAAASVKINGTAVRVGQDGTFATELAFSDRAMVVDVAAMFVDQEARELVPVFDGVDPRPYDPGAVRALLTPTGIDGLEPLVAAMVDGLGWQQLLMDAIPPIDTTYLDVVPVAVTSSPTTVDLYPGLDNISGLVTLNDVTLELNVLVDADILGSYEFPVEVIIGELSAGISLVPGLSDTDMLTVSLTDVALAISGMDLVIADFELPSWVGDYILDPILGLVSGGIDLLGDLLISTLGEQELGGPFAFSFDLMGSVLNARLAEVGASSAGVDLGVTLGINTEASDELPADMPLFPATTPNGSLYQLGAAVHEGMFNTLMEDLLADFLNIDLQLSGTYGELIGSSFRMLPGGDQVPEEVAGWCLAVHAGDARVVRMVPGTSGTLARAYLPDLDVEVSTLDGTTCVPWLTGTLFATADLTLSGTAISADINMPGAWVTYYGAEDVDKDEVAASLASTVGGLIGLLAGGALSFDLGSFELIPGVVLSPEVVEIAPLDETGLYGMYLNVF